MSVKISLIAAVGENGVIGRDNDLPWHIKSEFKYFKATTLGKPVVLGRKCYESLGGKPLPGRANIIVTRNKDYAAPGAHVVQSLEDGLKLAADLAQKDGKDEVFVAGGAEIYRLSLPHADLLYLTEVHMKPEGDIFFPDFDRNAWRETRREFHKAQAGESADYTITVLARKV